MCKLFKILKKFLGFTLIIAPVYFIIHTSGQAEDNNTCSQWHQYHQNTCEEALKLLLQGNTISSDLTVQILVQQHEWRHEYRFARSNNGSATFLTCTIPGPLILPQGKTVRLLITSEDSIYELSLPTVGVRVDAIPGRINTFAFDTSKPETFYGTVTEDHSHNQVKVELRVLNREAYNIWEREVLLKKCNS
ncbi:hypothetical protein HGO34_01630 [Agrobacterium vitis]|uniref:Cytochrome oxidase subunit II copper A binding domain-containing protein n=1 Tax=Agrobacterium vitis TaxID=373 RepID=A0AAE4W9Y3_AGRVI|nr:hypothetical protein [Agrobacterium vitis]MCF1498467.1 hypothetical protein [Allorhizobium sp. Av2]MCM2438415.1 hypothetical protein [Agrobacterium vitis]MUZ56203.1 hypothetical protein [Agrobacterium vitis]MVA64660.1 hypothetical protein [Agrobacterium vitis]MVA85631.1 hypothetical protein [Agrobacterium vitis]